MKSDAIMVFPPQFSLFALALVTLRGVVVMEIEKKLVDLQSTR